MTVSQTASAPQPHMTNRQIADAQIDDVLSAAVAQMLLGDSGFGWTLPGGSLLDRSSVIHIENYRDVRSKIVRGQVSGLNEVAGELKISYLPAKAARMGRIGACFHRLELWNKGAKEIEIGTLLKLRHRRYQVAKHVFESGHTELQQGFIEKAPSSFVGTEVQLEKKLEACAEAIHTEITTHIRELRSSPTADQLIASSIRRERLRAELAFFAWQAKQAGLGTFLENIAQELIESLQVPVQGQVEFSGEQINKFKSLANGLQRYRELGKEIVQQHLESLCESNISEMDQRVRAEHLSKHYAQRGSDLTSGARDTLKDATAKVFGKLSEALSDFSRKLDSQKLDEALRAIHLLENLSEVIPQSAACDVIDPAITKSNADKELQRCEDLLAKLEHPLLQGLQGHMRLVGDLLAGWKRWIEETAAAIEVGSQLAGLANDVGRKAPDDVKRSACHLLKKLPKKMKERFSSAFQALKGDKADAILELSAAVFRTEQRPQDEGHRAILERVQDHTKEATDRVFGGTEEALIPVQTEEADIPVHLERLMQRVANDQALSDADRQVHRDFIRREVGLWQERATAHKRRLEELDNALDARQDAKALEIIQKLQPQFMVDQVDCCVRRFLEQLQIQNLAEVDQVSDLLKLVDHINDVKAARPEFKKIELQAYYGSNPMAELIEKDPFAKEIVLSSPRLAGAAGLESHRMAELTLESRAKLVAGLKALSRQFERVEAEQRPPQSLKRVAGKLAWNLIKILFWHLPRLVLWHIPRITGKALSATWDWVVDKTYDRIAPVAAKVAQATGAVMGATLRVVGAAVEGTEAGFSQANDFASRV
jgi:hypothetical protein